MMSSPTFVIWRREVRLAMRSPSSWIVFAAVQGLAGVLFASALRAHPSADGNLAALFCSRAALALPVATTFFTMGLFAKDRSSGVLETLLTAPVEDSQVVLGKYLGALSLSLISLALCTATFFAYLKMAAPPPPFMRAHLLAGLGALILSAAAWCSIGLFFSVLARNERAAGAISLVFSLAGAAFSAGLFPGISGHPAVKFADISVFARGLGDTRPIFSFCSTAALLIFASIRLLESRRWTGPAR